MATIDYSGLVKLLIVNNIVFDDNSPLQPWSLVSDIIGLVAPHLTGLSLEIGDESFADLPHDYVYLHTNIELPKLKHISMTSKCMQVPLSLVFELLRASPVNGLESIRIARCMTNFDSSGWFLISERGGKALHDLVLSPSIGPNRLAWDEKCFINGLELVSKSCTELKR